MLARIAPAYLLLQSFVSVMGMKVTLYKEWCEYSLQYSSFFLEQVGLVLTYTQLLCFMFWCAEHPVAGQFFV